jgi:serine O-acetyltransferase
VPGQIDDWSSCVDFVRADLRRLDDHPAVAFVRYPQSRWLLRLRLTEWWCNTNGGLPGAFLRWRLAERGARLGFTIPINRLGPGIRLPHVGTIAVSGAASVGAHSEILPGVVLGANNRGAPTVDAHVFIGPGAKVIGPVRIGAGAVIGANAVVTRDVEPGATVLAPQAEVRSQPDP